MTFGCRCKCRRGCVAQAASGYGSTRPTGRVCSRDFGVSSFFFSLSAAGVALLSAFLTTALYTRRFRLISDTLRQAEAGTYAARPQYASHDEVGASLDLIDRLVMKQRKNVGAPAPVQRLAIAARTLAHEVKTPLNALAIHLEVLREKIAGGDANDGDQPQRSIAALDSSIRQVDRLVRDFTDYSAPVTMERKPIDVAEVLATSLEAAGSACTAKKITLSTELAPGPWPIQGDATRLRQTFDNLLRNAMEAQPDGGDYSRERPQEWRYRHRRCQRRRPGRAAGTPR